MNSPDTSTSDAYALSFSLTEKDAWALLRALGRAFPGTPGHPASPWKKAFFKLLTWSIRNMFIALLIVSFVAMAVSDQPIKKWQVVLVASIGLMAGASIAFAVPERALHPFVRTFLGLERERTIVLAQDGVRVLSEGGSNFIPWNVYSSVELAGGFVFIYRNHVADFIPVTAFSSEERVDEAARFIADRIKEARSNA